jgi:protein-S-isoprenylcysteine O-methyltransferase Ste14
MRKAILQQVLLMALLGLLLFFPSGTLAWPQAWIFLAIFCACSQAMGIWLLKTNPELLAERMRSPLSADQKPRDRAVMGAILLGFCAWLSFMGLDRRFGWSQAPLLLEATGAALILIAFYAWVSVLRANRFASSNVRLQRNAARR